MAAVYKGYKLIEGSSEEINDYLSSVNFEEWTINEYLIIHDLDSQKYSEMRYEGEKFVGLKLPQSNFIKGKNSQQRCALDLLLNKDIPVCCVLGTYGSGKTYLTMQMALYAVHEKAFQGKIVGVREPKGEGAGVGYLAGSYQEKVKGFYLGVADNLHGGEFELDSLIQRGTIETVIPYYLKGRTLADAIIQVEEAEDMSEAQIRLIGTRIGENSRIFFSGDYGQSLFDKTENNPLVRMCLELRGSPLFGCIYLEEDVRSEASQLFANLFK